MKRILSILSGTFLLGGANSAFAASSADLTVTGIITPAACTPSLSNGGRVDIGKISARSLKKDDETLVGKYPLQLTVTCEVPAQFALNPVDNQAGTSTNPFWFGLGLTHANEKLGYLRVFVKGTMADLQPAQAIESADKGFTWSRAAGTGPEYLLSVGLATDHSSPIAVKDLTMEFEVWTMIDRADKLTLNEDVDIYGSATFVMKYL
jgi:hypothetical protein